MAANKMATSRWSGFKITTKGIERLSGGVGTRNNGLCGDASPKRGTIFRIEAYKRVGISRVEVKRRIRKTVIRCLKGSNG